MDILRDLRTGTLIQKQITGDATFLPARDALRLITIEGAKTIRFDHEIGSLETGKRADLILLDAKSERLTPLHRHDYENLCSLICYSACGADVLSVMVDGEWLIKDRNVCKLDVSLVRENAQMASEHLRGDI